MTEAAAEAVTENQSLSGEPSLVEMIAEVAAERAGAEGAPAKPAEAAKPAPPGFIDPLDESNFTAEKLATPEGIKAARELLQAQVKEAADIRRKAHSALSKAEVREQKLAAKTKAFLSDKNLTSSQQQAIQRDIQELWSGDVDKFITAIGRLSNAKDPHDFWTKAAVALAKGKKAEPDAEPAIPKELQDRLDRIEAERAQEKMQADEHTYINLRVAQLQEAATFSDFGYVSKLAAPDGQPALIDARLVEIKQQYFNAHGKPLDTRSACGILEKEIRSHFEMLQRAGDPNGAPNGEREASPSAGNLARQPEQQIAKPETAPSPPPKTQSVSAIPSALAAAPSSTTRGLTPDEIRKARIAALDKMGVLANFGIHE